jgi:hypothetical protein
MIYVFECKATGDLTMMGPSGEQLLRIATPDDEPVTLRQRAWPLLEMLKRAHADDEAIVRGV